MPYYGQRPSAQQLQQSQGGNPFYNPYSKYPNIGMGISSVFNNIMAMKQQNQEQEYDRAEDEKAHKLKVRQLDIQEEANRPVQKELTDTEKKVQSYLRQHPNGTRWDAYKELANMKAPDVEAPTIYPPEFDDHMSNLYKTPNWATKIPGKKIADDYDEWQLRGRSGTGSTIDAQVRSDRDMINSISARFDKEVGRFSGGTYGFLEKESADNLRLGQATLDQYRNLGRQLTEEERQQVRDLGERLPMIRNYGAAAVLYDFVGTMPRSMIPTGSEIKTTPEGYEFVRVGGRILLVK